MNERPSIMHAAAPPKDWNEITMTKPETLMMGPYTEADPTGGFLNEMGGNVRHCDRR